MSVKGFNTENGVEKYDFHSLDNSPIVTPQMFGAKGDGVTDDTEAFKECFKYNNIYIPSGTYIISETIPVLTKTEVAGERYNSTNLSFTSEVLFELKGNTTIKDLNMVGNGTNNAVLFPYRDLQLYNVKFTNLHGGIVSDTEGFIAYNQINSCKFQNVKYPLHFPNAKGQFNTTIIFGCEFTDFEYVLNSPSGGRAITFDKCVFEGDGVAILNSNSAPSIMFSSCYIETSATLISDSFKFGRISVVNSWFYGKTVFVPTVPTTNRENLYITFEGSCIVNSAVKNGASTFDYLIDGDGIFAVDIVDCFTANASGVPCQITTPTVAENYGVATNCLVKFSQRATCVKLEYMAFRKSTTFGKEAQVSFDNTNNSLNLNWATENFDGTLVPMIFADTLDNLKAIKNYYYAGGKMMFGAINEGSDLYVLRNGTWHKLELDVSIPTKTSQLNNDSGYLTLETLPVYNGEVE